MTATVKRERPLTLKAATAAELMHPNPVSIRADALLREAIDLLVRRGLTAAPVIGEAGRPIGVISQSDLLIREHNARRKGTPDFYADADLAAGPFEFDVEDAGDTPKVTDLMTPVVFGVRPEATARTVIAEMLRLRVHRLFVIDGDGVLVGVVSMTDVLRHLID